MKRVSTEDLCRDMTSLLSDYAVSRVSTLTFRVDGESDGYYVYAANATRHAKMAVSHKALMLCGHAREMWALVAGAAEEAIALVNRDNDLVVGVAGKVRRIR